MVDTSITTAGYRQPIRSILIEVLVAGVRFSDRDTDDLQKMNNRLLMTRHCCGNLWTGVGCWNISSRTLFIAQTSVELSAVLKLLVMTCMVVVTMSYNRTVTRLTAAVCVDMMRLFC